MDKGTILVVEDEPNIADLVDLYLSRDGFRVLKQPTGGAGLEAVRDQRPRLVVLDVGPSRHRRPRGMPPDPGDELGAGDLPDRTRRRDRPRARVSNSAPTTTSPSRSAPAELVGAGAGGAAPDRRRADGRRSFRPVTSVVDVGRREIRVGDQPVEFTTKEFELLRYLAERPGLALSRQQILDGVWGPDWYGDERTVDVHIAQVRKKVGRRVHDRDRPRAGLPAGAGRPIVRSP